MKTSAKTASAITTLLLAASATLSAQQSPPGVCFAFNQVFGASTTALPVVAGGDLYIGFTAPQSVTIERIDAFLAQPITAPLSLEIFQTTPTGLGALLGNATVMPPWFQVVPFVLVSPVSLTGGAGYALRFTVAGGLTFLGGEGNQGTQLAYGLACGPNAAQLLPTCASYPPVGQFAARLSFRALACGPTPLAFATPVGTSCSASPISACGILLNAPPVLGSTVSLSLLGGPGVHNVFGTPGPATSGLDLGLGFGCALYLDPVSLQTLYVAGLEPIASLPAVVALRGVGIVPAWTSLPLQIPFDTALAGAVVTVQVLVTGVPGGIPTPGGGVQITNAVELHLGY